MPSDYPISGIKRTYRRPTETRTIVMPTLIGLVLAGMGIFYFQTRPGATGDSAETGANGDVGTGDTPGVDIPSTSAKTGGEAETDPTEAEEPTRAVPVADEPAPEASSTTTAATESPEDRAGGEGESEESSPNPAPSESGGTEGPFTPWMSPLALDTYIRQQNGGNDENFWERGHWMTAVEGRWHEGEHQFRIAYEEIPEGESWQWQYRANQGFAEFTAQIEELARRGYQMVQSQAFDAPEGGRRYQGVWRRRTGPTRVVDSENAPAPLAEEAAEESP